jgi:hypothetical protein
MKRILTFLTSLALLSGLLFTQVAPTFAAVTIDQSLKPDFAAETRDPTASAEARFGTTGVNLIIGDIAVVLIQISGVLAIYFIVSNGLTYVKSFGRDEEIQQAKKGIIWSIAGLVIILTAYAIVQNVIKITLDTDVSEVGSTNLLNSGLFNLF